MARHGINVADVQEVIETAIGGKAATQVLEGSGASTWWSASRRRPGATGGDRQHPGECPVASACRCRNWRTSGWSGRAQISREHGRRRISIEANVRGRDISSFVAEAQRAVAQQVELPPGYYTEWGGTFENLQSARRR